MRSISVACLLAGVVLLLVMITPCLADSSSSQASYIVVGQGPVAQFSAAYAYPVVPTQVIFKDYSQGSTPMTYLWNFGDGQTSTDQNPTHTYIQQGLYTVSLTVTNAYGSNTAVKNNYIAIGVSPAANFVATPISGTAPQNVQFTDLSGGGATSWLWDFGDGQTSTAQNPTHTYYAGGTYTVILTVSNGFGSSVATKNQYIVVAGQLQSKFVSNPTQGPTPLTVMFTDKSLGAPTTWNWDFGDGSTSTVQYPTHTYTTPGVYTVKLTVGLGSMSDTSSQIIDAGGVPLADFVATPMQTNVMNPIQFTDHSTNSPTSWNWNFGDTATSTDQNPTHSYQLNGLYTVTLTAANSNGQDSLTKVNYINVGLAPVAAFRPVINPSQISSIPLTVSFVDQSTNMPTSWSWDFGDGSTSTDQNPSHLYMQAGTYTVTLTATNAFGSNTVVKSNLIDVGNNIAVDFAADHTTVGVGQLVTFTDLSTNSPTNWVWEYGDGTIGSGSPNPNHAYTAVGVYSVTLTASNPTMTNSLTKTQYITVLNLPRANFAASPTRGGAPLAVTFADQSTGTPTSWTWDFGDRSTSSSQNPVHTYSQLGTYTVTLTVTNQNGSDTTTKTDYIVVTLAPVADFTVDQRIGNAPFIVQFRDLSTNNPTSWLWQFGDGTTSTDQNPRHVYPYIGAYNVTLTATNQYGSDTAYKAGNATTLIPIQAPTTAPPVVTNAPTVVATTVAPATTTQSPISAVLPVLAVALGLLAFAGLYRRK
ncbi:MAG: PKD domain-containing protein [Methanoregula sp.]|uniref:PKD domain-containing protein n=1 Tax=Methanoregula sp. TaxID=2052170 RepID=UPI003BB1E8A0